MYIYTSSEFARKHMIHDNKDMFRMVIKLKDMLYEELKCAKKSERKDHIINIGERHIGTTTALLYFAREYNIPLVTKQVRFYDEMAKDLGFIVAIYSIHDKDLVKKINMAGGIVLKDVDTEKDLLRETIGEEHHIIGFDIYEMMGVL